MLKRIMRNIRERIRYMRFCNVYVEKEIINSSTTANILKKIKYNKSSIMRKSARKYLIPKIRILEFKKKDRISY